MATISFNPVDGFDQLPEGEATNVLYNQLIPACEAKGVMLSSYGNDAGWGSFENIEKYNQRKASHELFNVPRIQQAFAVLDTICQATSTYKTWSYSLKHVVERHQKPDYLSNGDLIAAMLLKGHAARFGKRGEPVDVNCQFKVKNPNQNFMVYP